MFRRVATTLAVLVVVGSSANADAKLGGVARQLSMGGVSTVGIATNPFIFDDPVYQYINPAYQGHYKDYGWANIGGGNLTGLNTGSYGYSNQNGGVNFSLGSGFALGTVLAYDPSFANAVSNRVAGLQSGLTPDAVEVFELMGSYGVNPNTTLGLAILYGWNGDDLVTTTGTSEHTTTVFGARAGIYHNLGSGNAIEGSIAFRSSSADDKSPTTTAEASATEIVAAVRAKLRVNNKVNFIPIGSFSTVSGDGTNGGVNLGDVSGTALAVGAGLDLTVGDLYLVGGISYAMQSAELDTGSGATALNVKVTETAFPAMNLGAEFWLTDWLIARMGYMRAFVNSKDEFTSGGVTTEMNEFFGSSAISLGGFSDDNLIVLGLGGRFGNFSLEATVSESALSRGFGIIGADDEINSFGYFTAGYNFE
jgi:hypothetical protein